MYNKSKSSGSISGLNQQNKEQNLSQEIKIVTDQVQEDNIYMS